MVVLSTTTSFTNIKSAIPILNDVTTKIYSESLTVVCTGFPYIQQRLFTNTTVTDDVMPNYHHHGRRVCVGVYWIRQRRRRSANKSPIITESEWRAGIAASIIRTGRSNIYDDGPCYHERNKISQFLSLPTAAEISCAS